MRTVKSSIPKHLRIRFWKRWQCRLKWLIATLSEQRGCLQIAKRGGSYSYHSIKLFRSRVQCVYLRCLPFIDEDLKYIGRFDQCEAMDLGETHITDHCVDDLKKMRRLQYLFLGHTELSDKSIEALQELKQLRMLSLDGTRITKIGVGYLSQLLPNCLICYSDQQYQLGSLQNEMAVRRFVNH